jgi:phosphohistidine phosphatase
MRHAKSDWGTDFEQDFDRPLSDRGSRDADKMAGWLVKSGISPDIFVSSPAKRAEQTALIVAHGIGYRHENIVWDENIYDATLGELLKTIESHATDHYNMFLIGHCPGLDNLLSYLSINEPERTLSGKLMTTSSVAVLNYNTRLIDTEPHTANLDKLVRPKSLQ